MGTDDAKRISVISSLYEESSVENLRICGQKGALNYI